MIEITKEMIKNYLIDVQGYDEEEVEKIISSFGISYFSSEEKDEIIKYNK